jgi:hypothetical protein
MESDSIPEGVEMKFDKGKLYGSLPYKDFPLALEALSHVSTMGADKYARHSWKNVSNCYQRYEDAFYRHLTAHNAGEKLDDESGFPHQWHALWNLMALVQLNSEE